MVQSQVISDEFRGFPLLQIMAVSEIDFSVKLDLKNYENFWILIWRLENSNYLLHDLVNANMVTGKTIIPAYLFQKYLVSSCDDIGLIFDLHIQYDLDLSQKYEIKTDNDEMISVSLKEKIDQVRLDTEAKIDALFKSKLLDPNKVPVEKLKLFFTDHEVQGGFAKNITKTAKNYLK